mgnify:CR=1 FL=1
MTAAGFFHLHRSIGTAFGSFIAHLKKIHL